MAALAEKLDTRHPQGKYVANLQTTREGMLRRFQIQDTKLATPKVSSSVVAPVLPGAFFSAPWTMSSILQER